MSAVSSKLAAQSWDITIPSAVYKFSHLKNKFKSEKKAGAREGAQLVKGLSHDMRTRVWSPGPMLDTGVVEQL